MTTNPGNIVARPRLLYRPDPVIGWSLTPGYAVRVGFRAGVLQHIGPDGWRHVPGVPEMGPRVAVYGCSFTYGTGLADDETFTAQLQRALPGMRILNRGIGGHGTVQNLLQLRRDIANRTIDAAVFALISDHRFRNIAHPQKMQYYLKPDWYKLGVEQVPVARMDSNGRANILYHPIWQPVIQQANFHIFLPDDYMITSATMAVLDLVRETAQAANVPLQFVLLDSLDPVFSATVKNRFVDTKDISTPYDQEHTFMPRDLHPNVAANTLFATRLRPLITQLCDTLPTGVWK